MQKPRSTQLPADLPENWQLDQDVTPTGVDAGLTEQHGYNYQSKQINEAHKAINQINDAFANVQENLENITDGTTVADTDTVPTVAADKTKKRITFLTIVNAIKAKFNSVYAALVHTHGNITNDGKIGSTANQVVFTDTDGKLRAGTAPLIGGGTGASTAVGARTNLGLGSVATENIVPVVKGGTGASDAAGARTNLGITPSNIGAATATHNHNASDINAGTLSADRLPTIPVSKGGTGATDAATARTNLGAAPTTHNHNANDINTGTLAVERGGTGVSDLVVNKLPRGSSPDPIWIIYLSPSGNDTNTGLLESSPMKTIRAAVGKYGGLNRLDLRLAPGTYTDSDVLNISANLYVSISSTSGNAADTIITYPIVFQSTDAKLLRVTFDLTNFTTTRTAVTLRQSKYDIQNCVFKGKAASDVGINVSLGSSGYILSSTFQSLTRAVEVGSGASMTAITSTVVAGVGTGFLVNGGILLSASNTNNATGKFTMQGSAAIFENGMLLNQAANVVATAAVE